jgi:predicted nicotinamide N-methyase
MIDLLKGELGNLLRGKRVVELGSGTGIVTIISLIASMPI